MTTGTERCTLHEVCETVIEGIKAAPQMCAALDEVEGQEGGIDARLTRLAAALDDRLEDMAATGDAGEPSHRRFWSRSSNNLSQYLEI